MSEKKEIITLLNEGVEVSVKGDKEATHILRATHILSSFAQVRKGCPFFGMDSYWETEPTGWQADRLDFSLHLSFGWVSPTEHTLCSVAGGLTRVGGRGGDGGGRSKAKRALHSSLGGSKSCGHLPVVLLPYVLTCSLSRKSLHLRDGGSLPPPPVTYNQDVLCFF